MARGLNSLPYLEDETPNVLIDGFGSFFMNRLCLFKNAEHILDDEKQIEAYPAPSRPIPSLMLRTVPPESCH
jgi:hypothetical protein